MHISSGTRYIFASRAGPVDNGDRAARSQAHAHDERAIPATSRRLAPGLARDVPHSIRCKSKGLIAGIGAVEALGGRSPAASVPVPGGS